LSAGVAGLVVTSRAQNPTGAMISGRRSAALRRQLGRYGRLLVLEDDHAAELAHDRAHPLVGSTGSWAYVRSLSKPYGPDLRIAAVVGDDVTVARIEGRMRLGAGWVSTVLQRLVVQLWQDPEATAAVDRARDVYATRREALRTALGDLPTHGVSGINVWVPVPDETLVVARLREEGFAVAPGALYRIASPPAVRITTATLAPYEAPRVADAVARALVPTAPRGRSA